MAWNDVYQDDNAVHLLITIGGYKYNFRNGTDLKVDRKIGDTLNKFSLGIIDDGSDNYIEFERIVLNRFVNIEIEYGNSSKQLCKYTGFVVDYQPVFFGPSTKLTVTGYITRKQVGLPDQSSPYIYYIDWAPLVGKRKDPEKDWDDIYNGHFSFVTDSYGNSLNDKAVDEATIESKIAQLQSSIKKADWDKESKTIASTLLTKLRDPYVISKLEQTELNVGTYGIFGAVDDYETGGVKTLTYKDITRVTVDQTGSVTVYFDNVEVRGEYSYGSVQVGGGEGGAWGRFFYIVEENGLSSLFGDAVSRMNNYLKADSKQANIADNLRTVARNDTYSGAVNRYYQSGHVPWDYDIISKYAGNIVFSKYSHPNDARRSIARVVPDLFVEWDRDTPISPEYLLDSNNEVIGSVDTFPDWAINDIKMFGLIYTFNQAAYSESDGASPASFVLDEYDTHGIKRVYKTKNKYYIWVGDIPELYQKWKNSNWNYNSKQYMKGRKQYSNNRTWLAYSSGVTYTTVGMILQYKKNNGLDFKDYTLYYAIVEKQFTASSWEQDIAAGNIRHIKDYDGKEGADASDLRNYGPGYREFKITGIKDNEPLAGMKASTPEERITKYLQATYRSAFPITYGQVYISDIVAQLCKLEGWNNPKIVATTASSYTASYLQMNGMSALEYISNQLCPNAMESGGTGRVGFECYFDSKGIFHFEPIDIKFNSTVLSLGYNVKNSAVLSFTVRSRGQILMLGVDENISEISQLDGSAISVGSRQGTISSDTEARLNSLWEKNPNYKPTFSFISDSAEKTSMVNLYNANGRTGVQFFNLSLFNYYGYESNLEQYLYFLTKIGAEGSINEEMPYGTSLIRRSYKSSSSSSTSAYLEAIHDLKNLENTCIKAEMTIIGNTNLAPGQYIHIDNYTRKGKHYTSGNYYIQTMSDSVTSNGGFTQSLTLWRYSNNVYAMNNRPSNVEYVSSNISSYTVKSKFEEGVEIYQNQGEQAFKQWFQKNFPDEYYFEY